MVYVGCINCDGVAMNYANTLLGLLPPVSYSRNASGIRNQATIDGACLDDVQNSAIRILNVIDPRTSGNWLNRWEELYAIDGSNKNAQQRIAAVMAKINEVGGLSIPYFIRLAESIGYQISIEEPQPFRVGVNRAGDRLAPEDIMWVWRVNVVNAENLILRFRAGISAAGSRLTDYGDSIIESIFEDLKPAFTYVVFNYK